MNALSQTTQSAPAVKAFGTELLSDFCAFLDVSEKTLTTYQRALRQVFAYFKENGVSQPTRQDILNFKKSLTDKGRKPATISLYIASCRRFFAWTAQKGIYPNISEGVKGARQERGHKRDFFGATQLKGIMSGMRRDTLQGKRDYAVFALMATCGLRTVEVSRANFEDLRNLGGQMILYVQGKGRKDRTEFVKIPDQLLQVIQDYLTMRGNVGDDAPLFAGIGNRNRNGRMTTHTISQIAKRAMKCAGYNSRRLSAHSLRHSAVTISLLGGMTLQDVQAFARHANIATTTVYAHDVSRLKSMCEATIATAIF